RCPRGPRSRTRRERENPTSFRLSTPMPPCCRLLTVDCRLILNFRLPKLVHHQPLSGELPDVGLEDRHQLRGDVAGRAVAGEDRGLEVQPVAAGAAGHAEGGEDRGAARSREAGGPEGEGGGSVEEGEGLRVGGRYLISGQEDDPPL